MLGRPRQPGRRREFLIRSGRYNSRMTSIVSGRQHWGEDTHRKQREERSVVSF
jgi:hypothetical protein